MYDTYNYRFPQKNPWGFLTCNTSLFMAKQGHEGGDSTESRLAPLLRRRRLLRLHGLLHGAGAGGTGGNFQQNLGENHGKNGWEHVGNCGNFRNFQQNLGEKGENHGKTMGTMKPWEFPKNGNVRWVYSRFIGSRWAKNPRFAWGKWWLFSEIHFVFLEKSTWGDLVPRTLSRAGHFLNPPESTGMAQINSIDVPKIHPWVEMVVIA